MRSLDRDMARVLDANANRASEGVRVLEEAARMILNDRALAERCKELRHTIAGLFSGRQDVTLALVSSRDAAGDVFGSGELFAEGVRADTIAIVRANARRAQEAVRVLEEYVKLAGLAISTTCKDIRFALYDIEKKLVISIEHARQVDALRSGVLVLLDAAGTDMAVMEVLIAETAAEGAASMVLMDAPVSDRDFMRVAATFVASCVRHGVLALIGGRCDIALCAGAAGVLLGPEDIAPAAFRSIAGVIPLIVWYSPSDAPLTGVSPDADAWITDARTMPAASMTDDAEDLAAHPYLFILSDAGINDDGDHAPGSGRAVRVSAAGSQTTGVGA